MGKLAVAAIVCLWVFPISILVNRIVPEPYMDEIFHVPQAQQYCKGNFGSWDPMITTPPGLYYFSLAQVASLFPGLHLMQAASSISDICSPAVLRSINGVLAVICSIILHGIVTHLKPTRTDKEATLVAVVLALYPLHWFFTFLYYTDVASVTTVLAMYLTCLKKNYWISALIGAFAVLIRQTNIIWMLFVVCTGVINISLSPCMDNVGAAHLGVPNRKPGSLSTKSNGVVGLNLRKRKSSKAENTLEHSFCSVHASTTSSSSGLYDDIWAVLWKSWHMKWELLVFFSPFIVVLVAFIAFVLWNGSIVLGAKDAHTVSPHFAQILYFSLVSVLASAPMHFTLSQADELFHSFKENKSLCFFQGFTALIAGFLSVHYFSIAHLYLLADNRHYTFYLWRKIIRAHWCMKYILVPLYVYAWFSIISMLGKLQKRIWVLAYFLATAAVLIPAPLIELRYYTIPFFFLMVHTHYDNNRSWLLMGMMYLGVNVFTMMMFLFRPFRWDHEPGIQRFIW